MASMNRNLNLEEVNTDAFMGIPFLNHQTVLQKLIFVTSLAASAAVCLVGNLVFSMNANILAVLSLLPLTVGVAFGCNYNQDLSLISYLKLIIMKPSTRLTTKPTEDIEQIRNSAERIRQEEQLRQQRQAAPEEHRKLLIKLLAGMAAAVFLLFVILIVISGMRTEEIHHTVSMSYGQEASEAVI